MKDTSYFFGTGQSVVRISDRIYQPVDITSILRKGPIRTESETISTTLRVAKTVSLFGITGFFIGGVLGELLITEIVGAEFGFLRSLAPLFETVSISSFLSTILSAAFLGTTFGSIVGALSLVEVPE